MNFEKRSNLNYKIDNWIYLKYLSRSSNAAFKISRIRLNYPMQCKFKPLLLTLKWHAGRNNSGRIVTRSKGFRVKKNIPFINYRYSSGSCMFFIAGLNYTGFNNKISSLLMSSSGGVTYIPTRSNEILFLLSGYKNLIKTSQVFFYLYKKITNLKQHLRIHQIPYLLIQQKKNSPISFLEQYPLQGIKYTRSLGSKSAIIKLDTRVGLGVIKLSSGLKKVFSAFGLSTEGHANIKILKNRIVDTKSGNWRKKGLKSIVRGTAKNPVDHPNGGRTNSLKYPRTPWGKTTKFK